MFADSHASSQSVSLAACKLSQVLRPRRLASWQAAREAEPSPPFGPSGEGRQLSYVGQGQQRADRSRCFIQWLHTARQASKLPPCPFWMGFLAFHALSLYVSPLNDGVTTRLSVVMNTHDPLMGSPVAVLQVCMGAGALWKACGALNSSGGNLQICKGLSSRRCERPDEKCSHPPAPLTAPRSPEHAGSCESHGGGRRQAPSLHLPPSSGCTSAPSGWGILGAVMATDCDVSNPGPGLAPPAV